MHTQPSLSILNEFCGTEAYHKLSAFGKFVSTDGVAFMADTFGAFWLVDAIASYQPKLRNVSFQSWRLVSKENKAILTCTDGDSDKAIIKQEIEYTDFPDGEVLCFLTDGVLMLSSEY